MSLQIEPTVLDAWPFTADAKVGLKNLTDASSSISLDVGGYQITLESSSTSGCTCKLDGTAVQPTTGAALIAGFHLAPGTTYTLFVRSAGALHAIMNATSATGKLRITKVR